MPNHQITKITQDTQVAQVLKDFLRTMKQGSNSGKSIAMNLLYLDQRSMNLQGDLEEDKGALPLEIEQIVEEQQDIQEGKIYELPESSESCRQTSCKGAFIGRSYKLSEDILRQLKVVVDDLPEPRFDYLLLGIYIMTRLYFESNQKRADYLGINRTRYVAWQQKYQHIMDEMKQTDESQDR